MVDGRDLRGEGARVCTRARRPTHVCVRVCARTRAQGFTVLLKRMGYRFLGKHKSRWSSLGTPIVHTSRL